MKYVKDGEVKQINGEIKPFEVHEIGLRDAKYFLDKPSRKGKYARSQQEEKPVLYGADTYSSSGEDADESRILPSYINSSEDEEEIRQFSLMIDRVPENHYKDLTPREVNQIKELKVFVVPPRNH